MSCRSVVVVFSNPFSQTVVVLLKILSPRDPLHIHKSVALTAVI